MRTGLLALAAGLLSLRFLPDLPPTWLLLCLPVLGLMLLPYRSYPLALFLFGFSWACLSAQSALDERLSPALDGRTLWLEGRVSGLPEQADGVQRFQLEQVGSRRQRLPSRLRLGWYGGPPVHAGERWRLAVKLKRPRGLVNPQGFDYEAWLLAQRIGATGSVKAGELLQRASGAGGWRDAVRQRLLQAPAQGRGGTLAALVLGDDSGLSAADWRLLQDTGTVHLLVISGQHIVLLAGLLYALVAGLARLGLWPPRMPWLPAACGLAFAGALGYGLLAGFEVPVRRACVMLAVVLLWRLRFRHLGVWTPLLLALLAVLLVEPLASLQAGFWLSFAAVAVLALVFSGRLGGWRWWHSWWRAQWALSLGLLPLLLALQLPISLSAPLANLLAVPWVSVLVVPLALLGCLLLSLPPLGDALLWLAGGLLVVLFEVLGALAQLSPAWIFPAVPLWAWLSGMAGVLLLLLPAGVPLRLLGLALLLPLLWPPLQSPRPGRAEVWVLDVGQGSAVLVRTAGHTLLYDAGPRSGDFDQGARTVLPALRHLGIRRLDRLLLSHADADHSGGAPAVFAGLPVAQVLSGEAAALPPQLNAQACAEDAGWSWDGVQFRLWRWPQAPEGNPSSCVLRVQAHGESVLLTGDIDQAAERALQKSGWPLQSDWLLSPHHGSRSSSSPAFLRAVGPQAVLISRGNHNPYGHPHPLVMQRYRQLGLTVHDTVLEGALQIDLGARQAVRGMRNEARFWREK
ncbi:DNA internalization-related competence protein ComEC/Rec2 [Pseudomonas sp. N040]|uniref:DNA internalization-related competence protein ComEC/Rec2 n=1 Tax=Pseudomonas sp. N040 TaxID=2785325 RepID=UPI0018A27D96|nr:DNA internalization-related competence protein ComEC/Rec2 [Pseudomonas sp. N040]MBF7731333.1 DNA internalization-related competence protein ComEC/Rec2 [Pseudomonas sp. N040]MBW7014976.1 DNA internalization-related competence protein ComEC/Rec2 [Pseudomonas sp. N040]